MTGIVQRAATRLRILDIASHPSLRLVFTLVIMPLLYGGIGFLVMVHIFDSQKPCETAERIAARERGELERPVARLRAHRVPPARAADAPADARAAQTPR